MALAPPEAPAVSPMSLWGGNCQHPEFSCGGNVCQGVQVDVCDLGGGCAQERACMRGSVTVQVGSVCTSVHVCDRKHKCVCAYACAQVWTQ